jgi:hypothetical protein
VSATDATALLDRIEHDAQLAAELEALRADPQAVLASARVRGFDVSPDEVRVALLERYGDELPPEILAAISAGTDITSEQWELWGVGLGTGALSAVITMASAAAIS